jgi:hypothetical protein
MLHCDSHGWVRLLGACTVQVFNDNPCQINQLQLLQRMRCAVLCSRQRLPLHSQQAEDAVHRQARQSFSTCCMLVTQHTSEWCGALATVHGSSHSRVFAPARWVITRSCHPLIFAGLLFASAASATTRLANRTRVANSLCGAAWPNNWMSRSGRTITSTSNCATRCTHQGHTAESAKHS